MIEHLSIRSVEPSKRRDFWNRLAGQTYKGLVVDFPATGFDAQLARWALGDVVLSWPRSTQAKILREANPAPTSQRRLTAHIVQAGTLRMRHRGHEIELRTGDLAICLADELYRIESAGSHQVLIIDLPLDELSHRVGGIDDIAGVHVPREAAATRMLHNFLLSLWREGDRAFDPALGTTYAEFVKDMLATCLTHGSRRDEEGRNRLTCAMQAVIDARYGDAELTPAALADELGVSLRTLQSACARMKATPGGTILKRRLEAGAQELLQQPQEPITRIALRSGFSDSAYFTRRFHEHFHVSPSDYRRSAGVC